MFVGASELYICARVRELHGFPLMALRGNWAETSEREIES